MFESFNFTEINSMIQENISIARLLKLSNASFSYPITDRLSYGF